MLAALGRLQGATAAREDLSAGIAELSQAAELDLFGKDPYQLFMLRMEGETGDCSPLSRTVMLRAVDAHELTGTITAFAVALVLERKVAPGLHFAAEALDPDIVDRLPGTPAVTAMELMDTARALKSCWKRGRCEGPSQGGCVWNQVRQGLSLRFPPARFSF